MSAPLADLRIVAVEQFGAGPWGTLQLADLGAEVIKIEDPSSDGDVGRYVPPFQEGEDSLFFETFNRNKKSVSLELRTPAGREVLEDLIRGADAVYSNLRGDGPEKLRITYEHLRDVNPRIVCCSLSGFGMTGPRAAEGGYDYVIQALAGWMSLTGEPDGPPAKSGLSLVDLSGGYVAAIALLAGVWRARRDGVGCDCDISLFETALSQLCYVGTWAATEGWVPQRMTESAHPSIVPFQAFATADGWMTVACPKQKFWERLCHVLGRADLLDDERFADFGGRDRHRDALLPDAPRRVRRARHERPGSTCSPTRASPAARSTASARRSPTPRPRRARTSWRSSTRAWARCGRWPRRCGSRGRRSPRRCGRPRRAASTPRRCSRSCAATRPRASRSCAGPGCSGRTEALADRHARSAPGGATARRAPGRRGPRRRADPRRDPRGLRRHRRAGRVLGRRRGDRLRRRPPARAAGGRAGLRGRARAACSPRSSASTSGAAPADLPLRPALLHVDLKFVAQADLADRVEDGVVVWERDAAVSRAHRASPARWPAPDPQWIEDRVWPWVHYGAAKLGRGELFECLDMLAYLRKRVLGPLLAVRAGDERPQDVRRIERRAPEAVAALAATIGDHSPAGCARALEAAVALYLRLRGPEVRRNEAAESASRAYLADLAARVAPGRRLATVALVVPDYDEALAYFCGVLGFELVEDTALGDGKRWVVVRPRGPAGAELLLARASSAEQRARVGDQTGGRVFLFLETEDFAADHARYVAPASASWRSRGRSPTAPSRSSRTRSATAGI